jgi:prevent-host-death family protein
LGIEALEIVIHHASLALPARQAPRARSGLRQAPDDHKLLTMDKSEKTIAAGEFKAKCLGLLDEVARTGHSLMVTKRGRPVARLVPVKKPPRRRGAPLEGSVLYEGDIVSPLDEPWEALK